jgi:eukaryotic-like serine/threonine-protein kinase
MSKTEQWSKLKEIFNDALERGPGERTAYLDSACGADAAMRAEIESLLDAYKSSDGLSRPAWLDAPREEAEERKNIGPYQLIRKLGEGGMGQVWLAEQTAPVKRQVALKLVRAGMYDPAMLQRFQAERQSLAIMDHPAIAKVFDAGATPEGQPYFVMEYVPGPPITEYCNSQKVKVRERLELFIQACEGVQHAHQKAIMHRDLKPANILVVEVDGKPTPRIIDFGLAKAATPAGEGQTLFTQAGAFLGTPGYMSPEQADPGVLDVDTRTDVYSLGVVLYVLLTGSLPFETKQKQPLDEMLRRLREEDPPRPSTKLTADRATSTGAAAERGTEPKQLLSELRGDLDWITMKAVERDRGRRYGTPSELAADLRRYLNHEPVQARPASVGYRLAKYARRHRAGVAATVVIAALLVAFGVAEAVQLRRITRERDRANRITDFMTNMFKVPDPSETRGNAITAREVLDKASKDINTALSGDPELQGDLMAAMANTYFNLGLHQQALQLLEQASGIESRVLGLNNPKTLQVMSLQGLILQRQGHYVESENLLRETWERQSRSLGPENTYTLITLDRLGETLTVERRYAEAEKMQRRVVEIRRRTAARDDDELLQAMDELAYTLLRKGSYAEAEKLQREVLETERSTHGEDYPLTLREMDNLSLTLEGEGKYAEDEKLLRHALELHLRVFGPSHPRTLGIMRNLANVLLDENRYADAEKMYRQILDVRRSVSGPESPSVIDTLGLLGVTLADQKRFPEAEKLFQEAIALAAKQPGQVLLPMTQYNFACAAAVAGHGEEALRYLRQAIDGGYGNAEQMSSDVDLKSLRKDPRFAMLIEQVRKRDAEAAKQSR